MDLLLNCYLFQKSIADLQAVADEHGRVLLEEGRVLDGGVPVNAHLAFQDDNLGKNFQC
jgi:hypothetical protein